MEYNCKLGNREEQKQAMKEMSVIAESINRRPCKKCHSRGYSGWDEKRSQYNPCDCVIKAAQKIKLEKFKNGK